MVASTAAGQEVRQSRPWIRSRLERAVASGAVLASACQPRACIGPREEDPSRGCSVHAATGCQRRDRRASFTDKKALPRQSFTQHLRQSFCERTMLQGDGMSLGSYIPPPLAKSPPRHAVRDKLYVQAHAQIRCAWLTGLRGRVSVTKWVSRRCDRGAKMLGKSRERRVSRGVGPAHVQRDIRASEWGINCYWAIYRDTRPGFAFRAAKLPEKFTARALPGTRVQ